MLLDRMTWVEVRDAIEEKVPLVVPVGSIEQHGPHLPLGTDAYIPFELAKRAAARRRVVVAPPVTYAAYSRPRSGGGRGSPGSTGVSGRVLDAFLGDLFSDLLRQGWRRLVVLNGHWENAAFATEALERAMQPYGATHKALLVNWWDQVTDADLRELYPGEFPGWEREHASVIETALLEELLPETVRGELKGEGGAERFPSYEIFPPPDDIVAPTGVLWTAAPASRELGAALVERIVERLIAALDTELEKDVGQPPG
jgi:creatinine amidohydrolase